MNTVEAIKGLFISSGATWVMWLLFALSAGSFAVALERFLAFRARSGDLDALSKELDLRLAERDREGAIAFLANSKTTAAAIARAGLRLSHLGAAAAEKSMASAVALERGRLEARLAYLGTVGNNAPFVGLFGTVIGVIQAFEELGHGAPGHGGASSAAQVASQAVMGSIAEALVATAVGIAVALPAVALYNVLQRRVTGILAEAEVLTNLVLAYLSAADGPREPSKSSEAEPTDRGDS